MIKYKLLHILGIFYLIIGFIVLLSSFQTITGFAIIQDIQPKITSILGIILISLGLLISTAVKEKEGELEKRVKLSVYNAKTGQTDDESFRMTDPSLYFEQSGAINLGRFKRDIQHLRESQGGEELIKMVKDEYEPALKKIAESKDSERSKIAIEFLKVLDPKYQPPERESLSEKDYFLTKEEREEIKNAFRGFDGTLDRHQRDILRKYNLIYEEGAKHGHIVYSGTGYKTPIQRHLGVDIRTGLNKAIQIIHFIEESRKEESEKRSKKNEAP